MEKKKLPIALIVCVLLFILGCALSMIFSWDDTAVWHSDRGTQVVLSEIMPGNLTYPGPDGNHLDFVEIRNLSEHPVDISGYIISDDASSVGYKFPDGTVLPGSGYALCWCDKTSESDAYASFGISRQGGDVIYLYNGANVLVDQQSVPKMEANTSLIRVDKETWTVSQQATPGYANNDQGFAQWLAEKGMDDVQVVISEIMSDNSCVTALPGDAPFDWVELSNLGSKPAVLDGAFLSNDPADPLKWQMPNLTLEPGKQAVIYCPGSASGAPFALSKSGCTVILTSALGHTLSQVECPELETDFSWARTDAGEFEMTDFATPGFPNNSDGYAAWMEAIGAPEVDVVISEIMTDNRSTILSSSGMLCDWVELTNLGDTPAVLDGAYLSDDPAERGKWQIESLTIAPGAQAVIPCAGAAAADTEANFGLPRAGCSLTLSGPAGSILSKAQCPRLDRDCSWSRLEDGSFAQSDRPTPGFPNTDAGYLSFRDSMTPSGKLMICEVMSSNSQYLLQADGNFYDWVELLNTSGETIDLSDYCLSIDKENLTMFPLPDRSLEAGERTVVICSGNPGLPGRFIQAPFTIAREESWIYLSDSQGSLCDYLPVSGIPEGRSLGRTDISAGLWYFEIPTPGDPNQGGVRDISQTPAALSAPGAYPEAVSVAYPHVDGLHYTLDGSVPTADDPLLTAPVTLAESAPVRVVRLEDDKLPGDVLTSVYLIGQSDGFPLVHLTADPQALLGENGIYGNNFPDREIPCNLSYFYGGESFSADCGLRMLGNPTAGSEKNNMKLSFRGQYGQSVLGFPLFDNAEVFNALILEAPKASDHSYLRDALADSLCRKLTGSVPSQNSRFCLVSINGQFWGLYSLQEAMDQVCYAQRENAALDGVTLLREPVPHASELQQLLTYALQNDLSQPEPYAYVADRLDLDCFLDWLILEGFCGNPDIASDVRYFHAPGGKWTLSFSDVGSGFYSHAGFENLLSGKGPMFYGKMAHALMQNPDFRQQFLDRLAAAKNGALRPESVLAEIDLLQQQLEPVMEQEFARRGGSMEVWNADVQTLREFFGRYDHWGLLIRSLENAIGLSPEEAAILGG